MNLLDVVPLTKTKKPTKSASDKVIQDVLQTQDLFKRLGVKVPSEVFENANKIFAEERKNFFFDNNYMVKEKSFNIFNQYGGIREVDHDPLISLSESPRSTLSELRDISDKLGKVIMPFQVLDYRSITNESYAVRVQIESFDKAVKSSNMDIYVIAPLQLYDIHQHVKLNSGNQSLDFYSKDFQQIFTTIQLQIPLFSSIVESIKGLEGRVKELENVTNQIKIQVSSIQKQLESIQNDINHRREEEAKLRAANTMLVSALSSMPGSSFFAKDPLAFAVPKGTNIKFDNSMAIIGPAWGPDFEPELATLFDVPVKENQRKTISPILKAIWER